MTMFDQQRSSVQENVQRIRGLKRDPARKSYVPFGIWIRCILDIPVTPEATPEKIDFSNVKIEPLFEEMVDFDTFAKSDFRAVKIEACEAVPKSKKLLKFTLNDGTDRRRTILSGIHEYYEPEQLVGKTAIAIVNLPPRKMMGIDSEGMLISAVHEESGKEGLNLLMVDDRIPAGAKLY